MPRQRFRGQVLSSLNKLLQEHQQQVNYKKQLRGLDFSNSESDSDNENDNDANKDTLSDSDSSSDSFLDKMKECRLKEAIKVVESNRYLLRNPYRNRSVIFDWEDALHEDSFRFNDEEFLKHFRISRNAFWHIYNMINDKSSLQALSLKGGRKKLPIELQLLNFLKRLGSEGVAGNADSLADYFGIGKGTVYTVINRITKTLLSLKDEYIRWPNEEEKETMKMEIKFKYGFQNCIGIIDGTIIILDKKPLQYADAYWCRKHCYSLNVQVICDNKCRITYFYGGWPGSVHDNRAWQNCKIFTDGDEFFGTGEYLVGDCAYSACKYMVQTFKKVSGSSSLPPEKEFFNTKLGSLRVKSEHCIGLIKNRFPSMRRLNVRIGKAADVKKAMDLFCCSAILHNILLQVRDPIPRSWLENLDSDHYWTSDYSGEVHSDQTFDRREEVYHALLEDYYCSQH